jgi:hypothetical protein
MLGLDGIRLWRMDTYVEVVTPEHGQVLRGQPSCLTWARGTDDLRNVLAFGTGLGYLVFWWYDRNKVSSFTNLLQTLTVNNRNVMMKFAQSE